MKNAIFALAIFGCSGPQFETARTIGQAEAGPERLAIKSIGGATSVATGGAVAVPDGNAAGGVSTGGSAATGEAVAQDSGAGGATNTGGSIATGGTMTTGGTVSTAGSSQDDAGGTDCPRLCSYPMAVPVGCEPPVCANHCDSACDQYTTKTVSGDGNGGYIWDIACASPCARTGDCCA